MNLNIIIDDHLKWTNLALSYAKLGKCEFQSIGAEANYSVRRNDWFVVMSRGGAWRILHLIQASFPIMAIKAHTWRVNCVLEKLKSLVRRRSGSP
jgi:hypothetical protein